MPAALVDYLLNHEELPNDQRAVLVQAFDWPTDPISQVIVWELTMLAEFGVAAREHSALGERELLLAARICGPRGPAGSPERYASSARRHWPLDAVLALLLGVLSDYDEGAIPDGQAAGAALRARQRALAARGHSKLMFLPQAPTMLSLMWQDLPDDPEATTAGPLNIYDATLTTARIAWLSESMALGRPALTEGPAWPSDPVAVIAMAIRLAQNASALVGSPELVGFVPGDPFRLLPLLGQRFALPALLGGADAELARRLLSEGHSSRHFSHDHVAVIEQHEDGLARIVVAPERISGSQINLPMVVEHELGIFFADAELHLDKGIAVAHTPALQASNDEQREVVDGTLALLAAASWRDLVVADVREQHYERTTVEGVSRQARRAAGRRGEPTGEVIRYLPRRLVAERAARESGSREPRRAHAVGAHLARLPAGHHRSADAEAHAAQVGLPLVPGFTVRRAHARGGTEAERAGLEAIVRHWRSWSALDVLRARRTHAIHEILRDDASTGDSPSASWRGGAPEGADDAGSAS